MCFMPLTQSIRRVAKQHFDPLDVSRFRTQEIDQALRTIRGAYRKRMKLARLILLALSFGTTATFALDGVTLAENKESSSRGKAPSGSSSAKIANAPYGSHLEPILQAVQANTDQRKQITEVVEEFRPRIQPMKAKYRELQSQFLNSMTTGRPAEEIMLKQEELNELYNRIVNEYCVMNLKVRKLLNKDQFDRYEAYRKAQGWTK